MSKSKRYCYIKTCDLKGIGNTPARLRVYFEYDNTETDNRIYVEREGGCLNDAIKLSEKVKKYMNVDAEIVREDEIIQVTSGNGCFSRFYLVLKRTNVNLWKYEGENEKGKCKTMEI